MVTIIKFKSIIPHLKNICLGVFCILLLSSCGTHVPDTAKVIPESAAGVIRVNFPKLALKAEIRELRDLRWYRDLEFRIQKEPYPTRKLFEDFTANPFLTGLDYLEDAFLFGVAEEGLEGPHHFGLSMAVSDAEKFRSFIERVPDVPPTQEHEGYFLIQHPDYEVAWNKKVVIFISQRSLVQKKLPINFKAADFLALTEEQSIASNAHFISFLEAGGDASAFYDWRYTQSTLTTEALMDIGEGYGDIFDGNHTQVLVFFGSDYIDAEMTHYLTDSTKNKVNFSKETGVNESFLSVMSRETPLMAGTANLDIQKIYDAASLNPKAFKILQDLSGSFHIKPEDMPGLLTGEVSFAFSDLGDQMTSFNVGDYLGEAYEKWDYPMPIISAVGAVGITDKQKAIEIIEGYGLKPVNGIYNVDVNFIVITDDKILVTPNIDIATHLVKNGTLAPYENEGLEDNHLSYPVAGYVNLDLSEYPKTFNMGGLMLLKGIYKRVDAAMKEFDHATVTGSLNEHLKVHIQMAPSDHNSLYQALEGMEAAM